MQITSGCSQVIAYLWAARACGPSVSPWLPSNPLPPFLSSPLRFLAPSSTLARYRHQNQVAFFRSFDISPLIQITHTLLLYIISHFLLYMIICEYVSIIDSSGREKCNEMASMFIIVRSS